MSVLPFNINRSGGVNNANNPPPPSPPNTDELVKRVDQLDSKMSAVEKSMDTLKGLMEGFKDSLRAMQWAVGTILAFGLVIIGWMLTGMNGQLSGINTRLDRFLERQGEATSAANARFDRLLEQRSSQPQAPIVIQVPVPGAERDLPQQKPN